jgi:hypothetical protein
VKENGITMEGSYTGSQTTHDEGVEIKWRFTAERE